MKFAAQDLQSEVSEWAKLYRLIPKFRNNQNELVSEMESWRVATRSRQVLQNSLEFGDGIFQRSYVNRFL